MNIVFNDQQKEAIEKVVKWYDAWLNHRASNQVFFLAGYAGTGKTTVAMTCAERCVGDLAHAEFIAPTGKAASRLRQKGCLQARTMHQFIYNFRGEDEEGELMFGAKESLGLKPKLIVLDESSMIGEWDYNNLLKYNVPILALGDIGQLPPVKAIAVFTESHVDYLLDKIERQGADSNIIRASMYVRSGKVLPAREYDDVKVRIGYPNIEDLVSHSDENGQIICSFHKTRIRVNTKVRQYLGYKDALPQVGEKIVCKFNQHGFGIMNGEQGIVIGYASVDTRTEDEEYISEDNEDDGERIIIKSLTDGKERTVKFNRACFVGTGEEYDDAMKRAGAFDFGYALTVHSSQGSEWPRVLVIEEPMRGAPYNKLMYTAVTRAQNHLTIYRP